MKSKCEKELFVRKTYLDFINLVGYHFSVV